jgi:HAD superfamily hydrolase (TIGR01509 family)
MRAWNKFLLSVGKSVTEAELEFVRDGRKKEDILRHFLGDLDGHELHAYSHKKDLFFNEEVNGVNTVAGVGELLNELNRAGVPTAVASSGSSERVHHIVDLLGLRKYFAAVVTGDEVTKGKPDPAIFCKAAEKLGVAPSDALAFEDSVSGVLAARAAGMKCLGIATPPRAQSLVEAGAQDVLVDFVGTSVSQIRQLFLSRGAKTAEVCQT